MLRTGKLAYLCLSHVNKCEDGKQAVAGHICYVLAGLRERDYKACIQCLVSHVNEFEDGMQAVAGHICYVLAGLHTQPHDPASQLCLMHYTSMNVRLVCRRWLGTYAMCWQACTFRRMALPLSCAW